MQADSLPAELPVKPKTNSMKTLKMIHIKKKKKKNKKKKKRNPQTFELSFYLPTFNNML